MSKTKEKVLLKPKKKVLLKPKKKVPRKPKSKVTAYSFFIQACHEELKNRSPNETVNFGEFSKCCGQRWMVRKILHFF